MCDACEDWEAREPRAPLFPPHLAGRARAIEAAQDGPRVPEPSWRIALGEGSGAIAWADYTRIVAAFEAAAAEAPPPRPFAPRARPRRLACDAAG